MNNRLLPITLSLALLLFAWTHLEHHTDLAAHHDGKVCAECLFSSAPGNGLVSAAIQPADRPQTNTLLAPTTTTVELPTPFRHTLGQRGPPGYS
ncbi:MAG: hypothetical protein WCX90_10930 [Thiohalomonadaceae bacterium]